MHGLSIDERGIVGRGLGWASKELEAYLHVDASRDLTNDEYVLQGSFGSDRAAQGFFTDEMR